LVEVENTTNKGGGACWDFKEIKKIRKICTDNKLGYHLDGARLWNALVETNETTRQYGEVFDTISVCLSKGLGCPVGSVLIGDEEIMKKAINIRKIFGGNMRQAGYLAAAGLFALDNNVDRLKEDHVRAKEIESVLSKLSFIRNVEPVETNIIIFNLNDDVSEKSFINQLEENEIKIIPMGQGKLRMVTHLDYTSKMHDRFLDILRSTRF